MSRPPESSRHGLSRRGFLAAAAAGSLLPCLPCCAPEAEPARGPGDGAPSRPNVLFVFGDAHRACSTGCYGQSAVATPHMDSLARDGLRLTSAISCTPICRPFRATLMTGVHASLSGMRGNSSELNFSVDAADQWRPGKLATLGDTFSRAGYACSYVGKWHLGAVALDPGDPLRFGFDEQWFVGQPPVHHYTDWTYWKNARESVSGTSFRTFVETDAAVACLRDEAQRTTRRPWFLTVSYGPPHFPLSPPKEYRRHDFVQPSPNVPAELVQRHGSVSIPRYLDLVELIDHELGRLLETLEQTGMTGNTLVIYTSDHGVLLGNHNSMGKEMPYDESLRVPFLLRWPGRLAAGSVLSMPFGAPDILPTLAGLAGIAPPATVTGRDFSATLRGKPDAPRQEDLYLSAYDPTQGRPEWRGLRTERYSYSRQVTGPWRLFDLQEDPYELEDLVLTRPELVRQLDRRTAEWMSELGDRWHAG